MIIIYSETTQAVRTLNEATEITNINPFEIARAIDTGEELNGYTFDTDGFVISENQMKKNARKLLDDSRLGIVAVYDDESYIEYVGINKHKGDKKHVIRLRRDSRTPDQFKGR